MPAKVTARKVLGDVTNVKAYEGGGKDSFLKVAKKPEVTKKLTNIKVNKSTSLGLSKSTKADVIKSTSSNINKLTSPGLRKSTRLNVSKSTSYNVNKSTSHGLGKAKEGKQNILQHLKPVVAKSTEITKPLPQGVKDIDTEGSVQACSEYALTIYSHLRQKEECYSMAPDMLANCPVNGSMRAILADWLVEAAQQFKFVAETLYLTMNIIDRYLAIEGRTVFKSQLQLVGVSAMLIGAKIEEIYAPELEDLVYITDDTYTKEEIRHMELKILAALDWNLSAPLGINFLRRFSKAGDVELPQHSLAKYILELAMCEYSLVSVPASKQAAASLYLSLQLLNPSSEVWNPSLEYYSGYSVTNLAKVVSSMAGLLEKAPGSKLQAVRTKFKDAKCHRVACLPQLEKGSLLKLSKPRNF